MRLRIRPLLLASAVTLSSFAFGQTDPPNRAADEAAIREHIESIFIAFIKHDEKKLRETHSQDWRGFLGGGKVLKGLEDYIKYSAVDSSQMVGYKFLEYDTHFYTPDVAVVNYIAETHGKSGGKGKISVLDIYHRRPGGWIQVGSYTAGHPEAIQRRMSEAFPVPDFLRQQVLKTREEVWKAWFANDKAKLDQLLPEETIAVQGSVFQKRPEIVAEAQKFADGGGKLVKLDFPKTEIQMFGNTIVLYSTFEAETETKGKKGTMKGTATEIFVLRNGKLVNTGWHLG